MSLNEIRGYFDDSVDLPQLIGRLETLRDELDRHIEKLRERSNDAPPQVRRVLLPRQTVYRRVYPASTLAERTALLHTTALEGMRLYGTDITQRMYLVESSIRRPNKVSFCVAVPPESEGDHVVTLPATPALRAYARQHGFTPKGTLRRIYLEGPPQHKDPAKFVTQVALPLEEE